MNAPASPSEPHVMQTYGRLPIALSHGQGCWVWDTAGRRYLDGLGGIAVNTLGHNHARLVPALQEQIGKLIHTAITTTCRCRKNSRPNWWKPPA